MTNQESNISKKGARTLIAVTTVALIVAVVVISILIFGGDSKKESSEPTANATTIPQSAQPTSNATQKAIGNEQLVAFFDSLTAVRIGKGGAAIAADAPKAAGRVDIFSDFMCPFCKRFELSYGKVLQEAVDAGKIDLYFHPMTFLNQVSQGTEYSTRAASAFLLVAKESPEHAAAFNTALMQNQPAEQTPGLTDEQIAQIAQSVGVPESVTSRFAEHSEGAAADQSSSQSAEKGVTATPFVLLSDKSKTATKWDGRTDFTETLQKFFDS